MILTKSLATVAVAWHDRREIARQIWTRITDNALRAQPIILLFLLAALCAVIAARVTLERDMQREAEQTAAAQAILLEQQRQEAVRASTIAAQQAKAREDREAVARVLYGTALHHSEEAQKAVVWCIINRVESSLYPDTIQAVCEQESQWMGYSAENPVIESLYAVADEVLGGWEAGGYRAISPDYLFLTWTRDEIVLRTSYTEGRNTHYWRVS